MPPDTVLIVEDHPTFLKGLTHLLAAEPGLMVVAETTTAHQALEELERKKPTVALVDLTLGETSGLDLIKDIRLRSPETKVLVLSMHEEKYYAERALAAGALGYCMKEEAVDHIVAAIRSVVAGQVWLSPRFDEKVQKLRSMDGWIAAVQKLSDREFQVFTVMGLGLGTSEIAARLHLSAKTIDTHKEKIKVKLGCRTSQDLRQRAIEWRSSENLP